MKRVAILGTWKSIQSDIAEDVAQFTRQVVQRGDKIMTGGGPGVEYIVIQEALKWDTLAENLEVILPVPLENYKSHVMKSAVRNVIAKTESDDLIRLLQGLRLKNRTTLKAMKLKEFSNDGLISRNQAVVDIADELIAFQINDSSDIEAGIERARKREIPARIMHYYR
jgi:hypothetical protein